MKKKHESCHIIILYKDRFLLQKRDGNKKIHFPGFWGLFGGKINKKEKATSAIQREIYEETNLNKIYPQKKLKFIIEGKQVFLRREITYFVCKLRNYPKNLKIYEGIKFGFFKFHEIKKLKINPFDFAAISFHYYNNIKKQKIIPRIYPLK